MSKKVVVTQPNEKHCFHFFACTSTYPKKDNNNNNKNYNIAKKDSVDLKLLLAVLECINFELTEAEKCFDKEGR